MQGFVVEHPQQWQEESLETIACVAQLPANFNELELQIQICGSTGLCLPNKCHIGNMYELQNSCSRHSACHWKVPAGLRVQHHFMSITCCHRPALKPAPCMNRGLFLV